MSILVEVDIPEAPNATLIVERLSGDASNPVYTLREGDKVVYERLGADDVIRALGHVLTAVADRLDKAQQELKAN